MSTRTINFTLNGMEVSTEIEPHRNLVELLQRFDLFGARESCGQGLCGCCTVLVDDKAVSGCLYFAPWVDGKSVTTVESLDADGALSIVQQAFIDCGAGQLRQRHAGIDRLSAVGGIDQLGDAHSAGLGIDFKLHAGAASHPERRNVVGQTGL